MLNTAHAAPVVTLLDDGDAGVDTTGWGNFNFSGEFGGDQKFINDGGTSEASYAFSGLADGTYRVFSQWRGQAGTRTTDAEYTITGYGGSDVVVDGIDQQNAPAAGLFINDTNGAGTTVFPFQQLTTVTVSNGSLTLEVRDNDGTGAGTFAIADAAAVQLVSELDTVDWTSGVAGTLGGADVTLTTSAPGLFGSNWASYAGSDAALPAGVSNNDGVAIGAGTVSVSLDGGTVVDPILLFNFGEFGQSLDFGSLPFMLLDQNEATLSGSVVTFGAGASNVADDGFSIQLFGNYSDFSFTYTGTGTTGFSFGGALTAPEPGSATIVLISLASLGLVGRRRRRRV